MQTNLFREKFTEILIFVLFVAASAIWIEQGYPPELRDYVRELFIAFLTIAGVRRLAQPQTINADTVSAEYVEKASTQTGDINAAEINQKETNKNEDI